MVWGGDSSPEVGLKDYLIRREGVYQRIMPRDKTRLKIGIVL